MTGRAAIARHRGTRTVRPVIDTATTRYQQLIGALLAQASEPETAPLLLCATSLARHWELFHPETVLDRGTLHVPRTSTNGMVVPARQITLPPTLTVGVREVRGTTYDLLGLNGRRHGGTLERHRTAAAQLEVPYELDLEGLFVVHLEALVAAAATERQLQAILLTAGIPRNTRREHRLREGGLAAELAWVPATTDTFLGAAMSAIAEAT